MRMPEAKPTQIYKITINYRRQGKYIFISMICQQFEFNLTWKLMEYRLDLHEDTQKNLVTATKFEFPGFSKDEVQLDFRSAGLTVSAEAGKKSNKEYTDDYISCEHPYGKSSHTIQLP